jgi:hypothetical protein
MKHKLKNLIFANRPELEGKCWHRLANVLIYGSTIVVTLFAILLIFSNTTFERYTPTAYSFEPSYQDAKGKEYDCYPTAENYFGPNVVCNYTNIDINNFLSRYESSTSVRPVFTPYLPNLTANQIELNEFIRAGDLLNIRAKIEGHIRYGAIIWSITYILSIAIVWFIFWESIVYKSILYIVYGK